MILKIYEPKQPEALPEKEVYLKLEDDSGEITLVACDKDGKTCSGGNLATISPRGIHLWVGVNGDIGFSLDGLKLQQY